LRTYARWVCLSLLAVACAPHAGDEPLDVSEQAIVYGTDDRTEVYAHPDSTLRAIAQSSVVSLIPRSQFSRTVTGNIRIYTRLLSDAFDVCDDQPFADQPTAAVCSGVLLDDDLVLTAGHCFPSDGCDRYAFAFDYYYRADGELQTISWGDIYGCKRIVDRVVTPEGSPTRLDYALVQLDRPAVGRTPIEVRPTPLTTGEPLATIGSASGLPAKIDSGSRVIDSRAGAGDFFLLDSDTFEGSSGSGVFDVGGKLVGVLVRGGRDYAMSATQDCMVSNVIANVGDAGLPQGVGEEATYASRVTAGLCARGWPSERLCGTTARCGDGYCSARESRATCSADCECAQASCLGYADPPATPGPAVLKSKSHADDGCTLGGRPERGLASLLLAFAGLLLSRCRRARF
jgi:hypothetical protein